MIAVQCKMARTSPYVIVSNVCLWVINCGLQHSFRRQVGPGPLSENVRPSTADPAHAPYRDDSDVMFIGGGCPPPTYRLLLMKTAIPHPSHWLRPNLSAGAQAPSLIMIRALTVTGRRRRRGPARRRHRAKQHRGYIGRESPCITPFRLYPAAGCSSRPCPPPPLVPARLRP